MLAASKFRTAYVKTQITNDLKRFHTICIDHKSFLHVSSSSTVISSSLVIQNFHIFIEICAGFKIAIVLFGHAQHVCGCGGKPKPLPRAA